MKVYKFADYVIKIYENYNEIPQQPEGCLSTCENQKNKPIAIEIIGNGFKPCKKPYIFCSLIDRLERGELKLVLDQK